MTDAPDRIWAWLSGECNWTDTANCFYKRPPWLSKARPVTEYVRDDLASPDATLLAAEMRDRAVEAGAQACRNTGKGWAESRDNRDTDMNGVNAASQCERFVAEAIAALPLPSDPLAAALARPEIARLVEAVEVLQSHLRVGVIGAYSTPLSVDDAYEQVNAALAILRALQSTPGTGETP